MENEIQAMSVEPSQAHAENNIGEETFREELKLIHSDRIRNLTIKVFSLVHPKFFSAPASSTGKYHPLYALGEGGLVRHTKAAVFFLQQMMNVAFMNQMFTDRERDLMTAALLLHDTCKNGIEWSSNYTVEEHPALVSDMVKKSKLELCADDNVVLEQLCYLIQSHMGDWGMKSNVYKDKVKFALQSNMQKLVHLCDYLASRREINLNIFGDSESAANSGDKIGELE